MTTSRIDTAQADGAAAEALKRRLQAIEAAGWAFEDPGICRQMVEHMGSTDPELRDRLIATGLSELVSGPHLNPAQLSELFDEALIGLLHGIDAPGDAVLRRSFSALLVADLIDKDSEKAVLSEAQFACLFKALAQYLQEEQDFRGFDAAQGWIHALAHVADLVLSYLKSPRPSPEQKAEAIRHLIAMLCRADLPLWNDEDERVATAVLWALEQSQISMPALLHILCADKQPSGDSISNFNKKTFLKSLYFRLQPGAERDLPEIAAAIRAMSGPFYET